MTAYRTRPPVRPARAGGDWQDGDPSEETSRGGTRLAIVALAVLAIAVLCVAGYVVIRVFSPGTLRGLLPVSTPVAQPPTAPLPTATRAEGQASLTVEPAQGAMGDLVTVSGLGWLPGEPVFVFLRSPEDPTGRGNSYAAAVAAADGSLRTAFTFPREPRWLGQPYADLLAQGMRSGLQAAARFGLLAATPTNTLLPTVRATFTPVPSPTPTATPTPAPSATPIVIITDWQGEYFANPSLAGQPALVRNDVAVDFDWGQASPAPGLPSDGFSARWRRWQSFPAGLTRFSVGADDGIRVWVDGQLLVDQWRDGPFYVTTFDRDLVEGLHSLEVAYYENLGDARILLAWKKLIPTETPTPTPSATATATATPSPSPMATPTPWPLGPWQGEYFANLDLTGEPALVRSDPDLSFFWGAGSPAPEIPPDHFSARWTQESWIAGGDYRIRVDVDDGVRLWLDDVPLIDEWVSSGGTTYATDVTIPEGMHRFKVEYFDDSERALIQVQLLPRP